MNIVSVCHPCFCRKGLLTLLSLLRKYHDRTSKPISTKHKLIGIAKTGPLAIPDIIVQWLPNSLTLPSSQSLSSLLLKLLDYNVHYRLHSAIRTVNTDSDQVNPTHVYTNNLYLEAMP